MARPKSDLDLRKLHIDGGKKRSRKDRKKPDPPENLKAGEAEARAFADTLPLMPGVIVEDRKDRWEAMAPHNDEELWLLQLVQAFGTRSTALLRTFLYQLARLCPEAWDPDRQAWKTNETTWNAVLALVADWKPENSAQAALAAQMAATHMMTMKLSEQALNRGNTVYERDAAIASKLARTFAMQCETMQALKGQSRVARQSIHVTRESHQHIHYHEGGRENDGQAHESRARDPESSDTLSGDGQIDGEAVQGTSRDRQACLPQARRSKRDGRAEG